MDRLRMLGSPQPFLREGLVSKAGPIKTDQDFFIVDAPFKTLLIAEDLATGQKGNGEEGVWEVETLAKAIKAIHGVLEVGIFCGPTGPEASAAGVVGGQRPVACYFGMEDGSVTVRKARNKRRESVTTYPPLMPTKSITSN
jgi:ribose 5-phosphate isomerase A